MSAIIFAGNVASGKSTLWNLTQKLLKKNRIPFIRLSDRLAFEQAVLGDTGVDLPYYGYLPVVGRRSEFQGGNELGKIKFFITAGELANEAHAQMIQTIADYPSGLYVVEFTIAPQVPTPNGEDIMHTGDRLLKLLEEFGCADDTLLVEPYADINERILRNSRREDSIPPAVVEKYFYDGGYMPSDSAQRLRTYFPLDNRHDDLDRFIREGSTCVSAILTELIEGKINKER